MFESIWIHQTLELIVGLWADLRSIKASISQILSTEPIDQTSTMSASGENHKKYQMFFLEECDIWVAHSDRCSSQSGLMRNQPFLLSSSRRGSFSQMLAIYLQNCLHFTNDMSDFYKNRKWEYHQTTHR